jgi:DNA-binding transcriptional MocR family regulator
MPEANKKALVELLAAHDVPFIEDDLNGELCYDGPRPKPAKAFDKKGNVLLCSSFSKTLAPGYRVGWIAPGRYKREVEKLKLMTTIATATLPQLTVAAYLDSGGYDRHLRAIRRMFRANILSATGMIGEYFPQGTKVTRPTGGFVLWIELPEGTDSLELHRHALEENISICPGPMFSARQRHRNFIRLSCAHEWSDRIRIAVARIGELARQKA